MNRQTLITGAELVGGILVCAVLLAIRTALAEPWARALVAALAFAIFAAVLVHARSRSR
jgi:hypothetical protein